SADSFGAIVLVTTGNLAPMVDQGIIVAFPSPVMMLFAQSNSEYSADFIINGSIFNVISTDKRSEIQKWLNAPNYSENFTNALNSKTEGTCEWILHHEGYIQWKKNPDILWIQGKVGCGKTFLL
ncbi:hypothetical protein BT96DRAFT_951057, partial [Gymnopus androsaceus JB14]